MPRRGISDDVELALKPSKHLIANPIEVNSRYSVLRELGLNARDAVSSTQGDALQDGQLGNDQVVSVIEEGGAMQNGVKNPLRTAGRP